MSPIAVFWGCVGVRLGIRVDRGARHLALNLVFGAVLPGVYHAVVTLVS